MLLLRTSGDGLGSSVGRRGRVVQVGGIKGLERKGFWRSTIWVPLHSFMNRISLFPHVSFSQGVLCSCSSVDASLTPRMSRSFFSRAVWANKALRDTVCKESLLADASVMEIRCCLSRLSTSTPRHEIPLTFCMAVHKHSIFLDADKERSICCD